MNASGTGRLTVERARPEHLPAIGAIYGDVVLGSPATFDLEVPGEGYWHGVLEGMDAGAGHFLLVAAGEDGEVAGYAKSGTFKEKGAYWTTCETSVYVAEDARGLGIGRQLYASLMELLDASPLRLAVAGVTEPNPASVALHVGAGFEAVGTFADVGEKFGRTWDVTWYQRPLGAR